MELFDGWFLYYKITLKNGFVNLIISESLCNFDISVFIQK